mgnify:CR=1 FL=1
MEWGMKNRLSRIFKNDNKTVMLAVDHGYFLGPTERLENARKTVTPLLPYADSIMLTRGILRNCVDPSTDIPIVLRVSGGASIISKDLSNEDIVNNIEDAIRINASALALSIFVGAEYEHQTLVNLGRLVDEGERYGIPILAVTAVGREMIRDARYLSLACRIAAELGAHMIKTYYCKDFHKVIEASPVPVIIAGGKKIPERDALELTYNAINEGAAGVDMGRNIWQSDYPVAMIKAVRKIVHENASVEEAYDYFNSIKESAIIDQRSGIIE